MNYYQLSLDEYITNRKYIKSNSWRYTLGSVLNDEIILFFENKYRIQSKNSFKFLVEKYGFSVDCYEMYFNEYRIMRDSNIITNVQMREFQATSIHNQDIHESLTCNNDLLCSLYEDIEQKDYKIKQLENNDKSQAMEIKVLRTENKQLSTQEEKLEKILKKVSIISDERTDINKLNNAIDTTAQRLNDTCRAFKGTTEVTLKQQRMLKNYIECQSNVLKVHNSCVQQRHTLHKKLEELSTYLYKYYLDIQRDEDLCILYQEVIETFNLYENQDEELHEVISQRV